MSEPTSDLQVIEFPLKFEVFVFSRFYDPKAHVNFVLDVTSSRFLCLHDHVLTALRALNRLSRHDAIGYLIGRGIPEGQSSDAVRAVEQLVHAGKLVPVSDRTRAIPPRSFVVSFMNLNLAHECNLACTYCFADRGKYHSLGGTGLMPREVALKAIDFLVTQQARSYEVGLFGGEPLLNRDVVIDVVHYALDKLQGLKMVISTNGVALDRSLAELLKRANVHVQLSCDGGPRLQRELRPGKGDIDSFRAVHNAISTLREAGIENMSARATLTARCPDPAQVVSTLFALGFKHVNYQPVSGSVPGLELDSESMAIAKAATRELIRGGLANKISWANSAVVRICRASRLFWFCSLGYNGVTVTPDGSMYACHRMVEPQFRVGHVDTGVDTSKVRQLFPFHSVDDHEPCASCWARYLCGGGCYAENYHSNGDLWKPWSARCELFKIILETILEEYASGAKQRDYILEEVATP